MPALLLCRQRLGEILNCNAFAGIGFDALLLRNLGDFHIPDKAIVDYDSLGSAFAGALYFKHINVVNEFTQKRCGQPVHSQKIADCRGEVFAFQFTLSALGKLLTERFYLFFQFHPFRLVLVGYRTLRKAMALYAKYEYKFDEEAVAKIAVAIGKRVKDTKEIIRAGIDSTHYTGFTANMPTRTVRARRRM